MNPQDESSTNETLILLHLPDILLEKILSYLSYNEIANLRIVCQRFNDINQQLLSRGFRGAETYHLKCQKEVKGELPRRESERRDHPLAHHCNILSGIETRISLLNMTFLKYIDAKLCCFIPGKVIDEIFRVLRFVQTTKNMFIKGGLSNDAKNSILKELRANVILKELRDISSMAMEHFEEYIMPSFKTSSTSLVSFYSTSPPHFSYSMSSVVSLSPASCSTPRSSEIPSTSSVSTEQVHSGGQLKMLKQNKNNISSLKKQLSALQNQLSESCRKITEQEQVVLELNRVLSEQTSKLADHETKLTEVNRKVVENEQKMAALLNLVSSSAGTLNSVAPVRCKDRERNGNDDNIIGASASALQSVPHQTITQQAFQSPTYFLHSRTIHPPVNPVNLGHSTLKDLKTSVRVSGSSTSEENGTSAGAGVCTVKPPEHKEQLTYSESSSSVRGDASNGGDYQGTRALRKRKIHTETSDVLSKTCKNKKLR